MAVLALSLLTLALTAHSNAECYDPSPAFPVPSWENGTSDLKAAFDRIDGKLHDLVNRDEFLGTSYSVDVASGSETLWQTHHTAKLLNKTRPGERHVGPASMYRIASITKAFTTLAVLYQHQAGKINLEDPVLNYIAEFNQPDSGKLPWKDITLRTLASQLSGIPREFAQSDLINYFDDPSVLGLPARSRAGLPTCDEYDHFDRACHRADLLNQLKKASPLYAPHQKSTYSNLNYELLGLVIENVTGMPYVDYIREAIFEPLDMASSTFETPPDDRGVIPIGTNYWVCVGGDFVICEATAYLQQGIDEGVQNPTGGIYTSSADLSKFVRYILTHFNTLGGVNWLMPASWSTGMNSWYGMPWEIFRTANLLEPLSRRPVTFTTKGGSLPGYHSDIIILEEYGLGITILVGGSSGLLKAIKEIVTVELVRHAEKSIWHAMEKKYTGTYISTDPTANSSFAVASSPSKGLFVTNFVSNDTDVLHQIIPALSRDLGGPNTAKPWHAQLIPTLLFKNETAQEGEIFRLLMVVPERTDEAMPVWDEFCATDDDPLSYAGLPLNEVVFWHERGLVELPAWNLTAKAAPKSNQEQEQMVIQSDLSVHSGLR